MTEKKHISWPSIEAAYTEEFGQIEMEVYQVAGELWPWAEGYSQGKLQDGPAGQRLLLQATAIVSRVRAESPDRIGNLRAYLIRTFKRLVLSELEKESGHRRLESKMLHDSTGEAAASAAELDQKILVQQIVKRMDEWMRKVFEQLVLDHTFEEIARKSNQNAHSLRTKYNKHLNKLIKQVQAEILSAEKKSRESGP